MEDIKYSVSVCFKEIKSVFECVFTCANIYIPKSNLDGGKNAKLIW